MSTKPREAEQRTAPRQALSVPIRIVTTGRNPESIDGVTLDISPKGLGVKFGRGKMIGLDALLETLVEDRLPVQVVLRLPQGSVTVDAHVVWWGLLGDDEKFALRAGVLLRQEWSDTDWKLIQDNLKGAS